MIRRTAAFLGATLLIISLASVAVPSTWPGMPSALADPGGNGKGNGKGGENGNGGNGNGNGGENGNGNGNNGNGNENGGANDSTAESGKDKQKDKQNSQDGEATGVDAATTDETGVPAAASRVGAPPTAGAGRSGRDYVPDEVVVANLTDDARSDIRLLGFIVLDEQQLESLGLTISRLRVPRQMTAPSARTLLASRYPDVLVDVNALYRTQGQLSLPPPDYPGKLIGWGRTPDGCGQDVRIGVLDTAVDTATPGLGGAHIVQRSFLPAGAKAAPTEHGTAIASILVGRRSGLLPGAGLAVASVFGADPAGIPMADVVALLGGLDWLVGSGARVINMSFAGDANTVVALALRRVINGRAIVVAAVGNEGPMAPPAFPADEPGVIGVTAVDNHRQSYADANRGDDVDFAAPGVRVWTPGPTAAGSYHTGTSFATPFVTAAVAARLVEGAKPDADGIADGLAATAVDLGQPGTDPVFGRGLIQLANPCSQASQ
jgi:minor extracellular protease Epr